MKFEMAAKYHQMKRSYEKLRRVSTNTGNSISNVDGIEAAEEFFTQCHHLKDWLKKEFPNLSKAVEDHISNSLPLSLAADYCNTFKHAGLDGHSRSGQHLDEVLKHIRMDFTPQGSVCSAPVEIKTVGKSYLAFDLATNCIHDWDAFLRTNNITIPAP